MFSRTSLLLGAVLVLLMLPLARPATAQSADPLAHLTSLLKRPFVPVDVRRLDGPATVEAGQEATFAAHTNLDVATLPVRIAWDFGDGATATSLFARHRYAAPGTYTVVFTLSNARSEARDSLSVRVLPPMSLDAPTRPPAPEPQRK